MLDSVLYPRQAPMKEYAAQQGHKVEVVIQQPKVLIKNDKNKPRGRNLYTSFSTWDEALTKTSEEELPLPHRHIYELISPERPVKPYLDLDLNPPIPEGVTFETVINRAYEIIIPMFRNQFNRVLTKEDFVWTTSPTQAKLSLHLIIDTPEPQLVFPVNHKWEDSGCYHWAQQLKDLNDPLLSLMVDMAVYSRNRLMRTTRSNKPEKLLSVLDFYNNTLSSTNFIHLKRGLITCLEGKTDFLTMPPRLTKEVRAYVHSLGRKRARSSSETQTPTSFEHQEVIDRMLELIKAKVHASAYHDPGHGEEDAFSPMKGVSFNFSDRTEPCFTGSVHEGSMNFKAHVTSDHQIKVRCFSSSCAGKDKILGALDASSQRYLEGAIHVSLPKLVDITKPDLHWDSMIAINHDASSQEVLDFTVGRWLKGEFSALHLRSPMDTGKTTMVKHLLASHFQGKTVLIIVYRQALADNLAGVFTDFTNYLDVSTDSEPNIDDRRAHPRVICQIDSLWRLSEIPGAISKFDLVICDEFVLALNHLSASTLEQPRQTADLMQGIMTNSTHGIITMDALWDQRAWDFMHYNNVSQQVVINDHKAPPRTFHFQKDEAAWQEDIMESLRQGKIPAQSLFLPVL